MTMMTIDEWRAATTDMEPPPEAYADLLRELDDVTRDAPSLSTKIGLEPQRAGRVLVDHTKLNREISQRLVHGGWEREKSVHHGSMAVDFHKDGVFVEIQFGKYAFAAENIHVKMPLIWHRYGPACAKMFVLVVPTALSLRRMSTGIASFESVLRNYVLPPPMLRRFEPVHRGHYYQLAVVGLGF